MLIINKFNKEWYNYYLLSLRERQKDSFYIDRLHIAENKYLHVGSVVLMKHPIKPRPYWTLCKIVELLPGPDGLVRVAKVLKADKSTVITSVSNLFPLELDCNTQSCQSKVESTTEDIEHDNENEKHEKNSDSVHDGLDRGRARC